MRISDMLFATAALLTLMSLLGVIFTWLALVIRPRLDHTRPTLTLDPGFVLYILTLWVGAFIAWHLGY